MSRGIYCRPRKFQLRICNNNSPRLQNKAESNTQETDPVYRGKKWQRVPRSNAKAPVFEARE